MAEVLIAKEREQERLKQVKKKEVERLRQMKLDEAGFDEEIKRAKEYVLTQQSNNKAQEQKIKSLEEEIEFRVNNINLLERKFSSLMNVESKEAKKYITEIRNELIKNTLDEQLLARMPEIAALYDNKVNLEENEFNGLVFDQVQMTLIEYSRSNPDEVTFSISHRFNISQNTTFLELKETAGAFFQVDAADFVVLDEAEGFIYDEGIKVNEFMQNYNVFVNIFKMVELNIMKSRTKTNHTQEDRMAQTCTVHKNKKAKKREYYNTDYDPITSKIKEFFKDYPGLKPYKATFDEKLADQPWVKKQVLPPNSSEIGTSFLFLVLMVVFYILTLVFLTKGRDVRQDYLNQKFFEQYFSAGDVINPRTFYSFLNRKVALHLMDFNITGVNTSAFLNDDIRNISALLGLEDYSYEVDGEFQLNVSSYRRDILNIKTNQSWFISTGMRFSMLMVNEKPQCLRTPVFSPADDTERVCYEGIFDGSNYYTGDFSLFKIPGFLQNLTLFSPSPDGILTDDTVSGIFDGSGNAITLSNNIK